MLDGGGDGLALDAVDGDNTVGSARTVTVSLDVEETRALLQDVPRAYRTQINEVLLTALVRAYERRTGIPRVWLDLEGHGREDIVSGVDLSRTVGWFTSIFPVRLELDGGCGPGEALKSVKEQLRGIPQRGVGYGLLRYLSGDPEMTAAARGVPGPEMSFNYLGQFEPPGRSGGRETRL